MDLSNDRKRYSVEETVDILLGMDSPSESDESLDVTSDDADDGSTSNERSEEEDDYVGLTTTAKRKGLRVRGGRARRGIRVRGGKTQVFTPSVSLPLPLLLPSQNNDNDLPMSSSDFVGNAQQPKKAKKSKPDVHWNKNVPNIPQFDYNLEERMHVAIPDNVDVAFFFNQLCTDEFLNKLVTQTNLYAQKIINSSRPLRRRSRLNDWYAVDIIEMKKFLGLIIAMGIIRLPNYQKYWSRDILYKNEFFRSAMKRDRFLSIMRFWHFGDLNEFPGDRLGKVRLLLNHLNNVNNDLYTPGKNLSLDESMVLWRGRLVFRQYIKGKRHKYGIKFYELTTHDGYILKCNIYSGKDDQDANDDMGKTASIVINLMSDYFDKGHHVFMDNFYNSYSLTKYMSGRSTYLSGTLRKDRKHNPVDVMNAKLKKGDMVWAQSENIVALKWKDKRDVYAISNAHVPEMIHTSNRRGKEKLKPNIISDYNHGMSGIDRADQMMAYHSSLRKTLRWYKKIGVHVLEVMLSNSYFLYKKFSGRRLLGVAEYKEAIINHLVGEIVPKKCPKKEFHYLIPFPPNEKKVNPSRECKFCSRVTTRGGGKSPRKETRYFCAICDIALCVHPCFYKHHIGLIDIQEKEENGDSSAESDGQ